MRRGRKQLAPRLLRLSRHISSTATAAGSSRIFTGELPGFERPKRKGGSATSVLCLHASHKGGALRYDLSHVEAKMKLIRGNGTEKDVSSFTPVAQMAEQLVDADVLVVASPMWNFTCPHVLKHYM